MKTCSNCEYTDGKIYTSMPPKYKCAKTNEFHGGTYSCEDGGFEISTEDYMKVFINKLHRD